MRPLVGDTMFKRILLLLILFGLTQILPVRLWYSPQQLVYNDYSIIVENTNLRQVIQKTLPACVYIEAINKDGCKWSGSGAIISPDGLIVTAGHVVKDAVEILVRLSDGREFEAIGWYQKDCTDVGIIKISVTEKLPYVLIGNSNGMVIGNPVFIAGCPFGEELFNTVTAGIISGVKRDIPFFKNKLLIQIDAATNPGNSGGGLFNIKGQLIGIVVSKIRGGDGIGFCVPSDIIKTVLKIYLANEELNAAS